MKTVALIGMTGVGKSTVGQELSKLVRMKFIDTDQYITFYAGASTRELFETHGEGYFRKLECQCIAKILAENAVYGCVLSCGGGAVTYAPTAKLLRDKSVVVWVTRPAEQVLKFEAVLNRPPINGDPEKYMELLTARTPLYEACAHYSVKNTGPMQTARAIASLIKK